MEKNCSIENMQSYLDLLKVLPKTNCGKCGEATCLLFSLKVFAKKLPLEACPYLTSKDLLELKSEGLTFNQLLENLKSIRERFREILNFPERAEALGCSLLEGGKFLLAYQDLNVLIETDHENRPGNIWELSGKTLDPRDEILIYNYFLFNGKRPLTGDFVGLESFPHSISKVKTLKIYAEDPLADLFSQVEKSLDKALEGFRVTERETYKGGFSFCVNVLPKVTLKVVYWEGSEEEGLSPECKVLFDRNILDYLDLECLVFCVERFAERLRERCK